MSYEVSERNAKAVERALSVLYDYRGDAGEWLRELVQFLGCDEFSAPTGQEQVDKLELLFNQYDSTALKEVEEILEKAARGLMMIEGARSDAENATTAETEGEALPLPMPLGEALKVFAKEQ